MLNADFGRVIEEARSRLGDRLVVLAHHYQHDSVLRHADHIGDSLELARKIPGCSAEYIVFSGVFFMAETAAILARPGQKVFIPDMNSRCVMCDMAPDWLVRPVLERILASGKKFVPLTYVNSSAAVKAVCGEYGGSVCTSANARTMMSWALDQGGGVFFLPDVRLGMNTCDQLDMPRSSRLVLDVRQKGELIRPERLEKAEALLWPGQCVIHTRFKPTQIHQVRRDEPKALVVVHPECSPAVVGLADACGSTSFIIRYVAEAPEGAVIYVGTEINLVTRLAHQYKGQKTVRPLAYSACRNMAKITEEKLAGLLSGLDSAPTVNVPEAVRDPARLALERMLAACAK
jgi:quinolinate synthase